MNKDNKLIKNINNQYNKLMMNIVQIIKCYLQILVMLWQKWNLIKENLKKFYNRVKKITKHFIKNHNNH